MAKGEFVFLVGPSGSGKSTFLRLVLKEERPSEGRIHVAGRDLARLIYPSCPCCDVRDNRHKRRVEARFPIRDQRRSSRFR